MSLSPLAGPSMETCSMNILLLNAGSSSLKATVMRAADGTVVARPGRLGRECNAL
jgi:acetate kinase